jgi:hypothetical protein
MELNVKNILSLFQAFHEHDVEYVLIGGIAVILHGIPRVTEDLDIFLKEDHKNIMRFKDALRVVFEDESIDDITDDDLKKYAVVRYGTPDNYYIDIFCRIGEVFKYEDLNYDVISSHGILIRIATIQTLIQLKQNTIREIDKADVLLLSEKLKGQK